MTRITATEASRRFSDLLNRAKYQGESFVVERNGEPIAEIRPLPARGGVTGAELTDRLRAAPPVDDEFQADMQAVLAESRSQESPDPWED